MQQVVSTVVKRLFTCVLTVLTVASCMAASSDSREDVACGAPQTVADSLTAESGLLAIADTHVAADTLTGIYNKVDTLPARRKAKRDWATWAPNPKRAMWLAIVLPGAGQVYNRKYWKLPIVYGGFLGCIYAWRWNNQMYRDYSQAYMDIMDDDPNTQSYNQFLHLGMQITDENKERYQNLFKRRKDYYRKYRDLSIFCMIGVYALSVIDAYVDASLSQFDISKDLSLKIEPSVMNSRSSANPIKSSALGLQCSLNF